jgi:hypothetical protein
MSEHTRSHKLLAALGVVLVVLLVATPVAAQTFPGSIFTRRINTGVQQYMKNYGYGASSIEEMGSFLPVIRSLNLTPRPTPSDHPIPIPTDAWKLTPTDLW